MTKKSTFLVILSIAEGPESFFGSPLSHQVKSLTSISRDEMVLLWCFLFCLSVRIIGWRLALPLFLLTNTLACGTKNEQMPDEIILAHLLGDSYARYKRTSMKGRIEHGAPGICRNHPEVPQLLSTITPYPFYSALYT